MRHFAAALAFTVCALGTLAGDRAPLPVGPPKPPGFYPWVFPETGAFTVYVRQVHDGDTATVYLQVPVTIRLAGINSPELKTPAGPPARDALAGKALDKFLLAEFKGREKYGRTLGVLWDGPLNLNQWMVDNQFAVPFEVKP
jgi:endonuclease YncB( thermonuclease family)